MKRRAWGSGDALQQHADVVQSWQRSAPHQVAQAQGAAATGWEIGHGQGVGRGEKADAGGISFTVGGGHVETEGVGTARQGRLPVLYDFQYQLLKGIGRGDSTPYADGKAVGAGNCDGIDGETEGVAGRPAFGRKIVVAEGAGGMFATCQCHKQCGGSQKD